MSEQISSVNVHEKTGYNFTPVPYKVVVKNPNPSTDMTKKDNYRDKDVQPFDQVDQNPESKPNVKETSRCKKIVIGFIVSFLILGAIAGIIAGIVYSIQK